jgi:hypothetical protein
VPLAVVVTLDLTSNGIADDKKDEADKPPKPPVSDKAFEDLFHPSNVPKPQQVPITRRRPEASKSAFMISKAM